MSNVRDFGAVGDGQVDDTQAIEHAIHAGDGVIEFPRGNYRITRYVTRGSGSARPRSAARKRWDRQTADVWSWARHLAAGNPYQERRSA